MKKALVWTLTLGVALTGVAACLQEDAGGPREQLLKAWGDNTIMPLYSELAGDAEALAVRVETLCEEPSREALEAARAAWWEARAPWKELEVLAFGPYKDRPLRLGPKLDFWPTRVESVEAVLHGKGPIDPALLGAARGLPALEYLLYQPGVDVLDEVKHTPRRCAYLRVLAQDTAALANALFEAWDPAHGDYLSQLTHGTGDEMLQTSHMALGFVVNRMWHTVENIRNDKLGAPVGTTSGGSPQPDKCESQFSGRSVQDIRDTLWGIERLFYGANSGQRSLDTLLRSRGYNFTRRMGDQLAAAHAALDRIPEPLTQAVLDDPQSVVDAIDDGAEDGEAGAFYELQKLIQVEIIGALSLASNPNDNDGD